MSKQRVSSKQRTELLAQFESSGLSAAAFARLHHINYSTFISWRKRGDQPPMRQRPALIEVVQAGSPSGGVEIQLGSLCRIQVENGEQAKLAAEIIRELEARGC